MGRVICGPTWHGPSWFWAELSCTLSDHDIVLAKVNAKPEISKQVPCTILLYKKADWDQLKQSMRDLHSELTQSDLATTSVQSMWERFATKLEQGIDNSSQLGNQALGMDSPG